MKISKFAMDGTLAQEGVWEDAGHDDLRVKVARMNNPRYREYLRALGRPLVRRSRRNMLDFDAMEAMTQKAVARYVLLDWKNLEDDEGNEIPYSPDKAFEFFKAYPDFYEAVTEIANDVELFRAEDHEDAAGNLQASSGGS